MIPSGYWSWRKGNNLLVKIREFHVKSVNFFGFSTQQGEVKSDPTRQSEVLLLLPPSASRFNILLGFTFPQSLQSSSYHSPNSFTLLLNLPWSLKLSGIFPDWTWLHSLTPFLSVYSGGWCFGFKSLSVRPSRPKTLSLCLFPWCLCSVEVGNYELLVLFMALREWKCWPDSLPWFR